MKRTLRNALLTILLVSGLLLSGSSFSFAQTNSGSSSSAEPPHISSVSPIAATATQTITITGNGFGNTQPQLLDLGDGSVDTVGGGSTPTIYILDKNTLNGWQAGIQKNSTWGWDSIGIILDDWSNNKIVLGGFGSALSTNGEGEWVISPGDPILIDVQTVNGGVNYTTTVSSNQPIESPPTSSGAAPTITSVSPIADTRLQTIIIQGSGFGDTQPQLLNLGDGSVDTIGGGTTPVIRIYDLSSADSWEAGVQDSPTSGADSIGIVLTSWSDTKIVLGGFGSALSTDGQAQWSIAKGDPLLIAVLTTNGQAAYTTTVGSNAPAITLEPTAITYVSPIAAARNQTIIINGDGFGDIQPQLMNMSDGLLDTVAAGTTPVLRIYDEEGLDSWEAGCQDAISSGPIGINLVSWSDHQIVLGGFGSELSVNGTGPWNINPGDPLIVDVLTSNGQAAYTLTAASNSTNPLETTLNVTCQSSTTISNFQVIINGNLNFQGVAIPDATIALYYSVNEGNSWQQLTTVNTDANGNFVAEWLPSVTGNYMLNATYTGDAAYPAASTIVNFVVTPDLAGNPQVAFSIASNSTVTDFAFNSTSQQLSFTVSGPSGTHGYADVYIAKSLVNSTSNIKAYLDNNSESFTVSSNANSWILQFSYHLCTHQVVIDLNSQAANAVNLSGLLWGIAYGAAISIGVIVALLLVLRRDKNKNQTTPPPLARSE